MGLIDTLSGGFKVVQRRPWLALFPILLDLWLWLGPRWSIQPLVDSLLRWWRPDTLPADVAAAMAPYRELLVAVGASFNLWWLVDNNPTWLRTALPGLAEPARLAAEPGVITMSSAALLLWAPLLLLLGAALGSLFLAAVASQVAASRAGQAAQSSADNAAAGGQPQPQSGAWFWLGRALRTFALAVVLGLLALALLVAASVLLSLILTPILMVSPQAGVGAASVASLLIGWFTLVAYIMLYFVLAAVVSDGIGLGQALWRSFNVVYRNFWATLGLLLLTTLILWGFGLIWQRLAAASPVGVLAAIAGNAVLVTGLTAARLIFYQERSARWLENVLPRSTVRGPE